MSPIRWAILAGPPLSGACNMARDHALAASLAPGHAILRFYGWASPTISFGRNEPAASYAHLEGQRVEGRELDFVRRPTGGRAVLHDDEVTYSVVLGARSLGGARDAYAAVNRALLRAMTDLGVHAEMVMLRDVLPRTGSDPEVSAALIGDESSSSLRPNAGPCFQHASSGEITVAGRKLVGSAQVRIGRAILQHGSILLSRRATASRELEPLLAGATSLEELLGRRPSADQLVDACTGAFEGELGGAWPEAPKANGWGSANEGSDLRSASKETSRADVDPSSERELAAHYASDDWTWRQIKPRPAVAAL